MNRSTIIVLSGLLLGCAVGSAQTLLNLRDQARNADFSNSMHTKPMKTGTVLPAVCTVGEMYFKTDAPDGKNLYGCTADNVWSLQADGAQEDKEFAVTSSGPELIVGPECSVTEPCRARFGNTVYKMSNPGTATITGGSGSGVAKLYLSSTGVMLSIPSNAGLTVTASGLTVESVSTPSVPSTGIPLADIAISSGSWGAISDQQAVLSTVPLIAGSGIIVSGAAGSSKIDVDPSVVPLLAGVNNYTGQLLATGASKTAPFKIGPVDPATCDPSIRESFFNTTANVLKFCTTVGSQGVWSTVSSAWGSIGGTLADQADLNTALASKVNTTRTVNGHALLADVTVTKADVGLSNVDNTSDTNKPISTATQAALDAKANSALLAPVALSGSYSDLSNKPTIPSVPTTGNVLKGNSAGAMIAVSGNPTDCVYVNGGSGPCGSASGGSASAPLALTGTSDAIQLDVTGNAIQTSPIMRVRTKAGVTAFQVNNDGSVQMGSGNGPMSVPALIADPPSPSNGDIWYNSTIAKFRKKENDVVGDWGGSSGASVDTTSLQYRDDFRTQFALNCAAQSDRGCGELQWTANKAAGATLGPIDIADGREGVYKLQSGTTDTEYAEYVLGGYGSHYPFALLDGTVPFSSSFIFKVQSPITNSVMRVGFSRATDAVRTSSARMDLRYDSTQDTSWKFVSQTTDTTGSYADVVLQSDGTTQMVPTTGHWYKLFIKGVGTGATALTFQLWDQTCGSATNTACVSQAWTPSTAPSGASGWFAYFGVKCAACTATRDMYVDFFGFFKTFTSR